MSPLRIGIVGTGFVAGFHAKAFRSCPDVAIAGFAGGAQRAAALATEYGGRAFASCAEMLAASDVDALVIASINPLHVEQALAAIAAGKPALVEKPVASDLAALDRIGAAARRGGVLVFPGHNFLYRGAVGAAKAALDAGRIGRVVHSTFTSVHTVSPAHAAGWRGRLDESWGGALMDSGHHQVYQSLYLRGRPVSVQAFTARCTLTGMEGEDVAQVALQYADGSTGCLTQIWATGHGGRLNGINLLGTEGDIVIDERLLISGAEQPGDTGYAESFANQARAFVDAVRGRGQPLMGLDGAGDALRLIDTAYRSARERQVLPFPAAMAAAAAR